jgi:CheY-like chemotaxis protein/anti-sigma regulatory factor (Ser/Thr protein kinase)
MAWFYVKNSLPYIIGVTVCFTIYEMLKQVILPGISIWQSHIMSITVVALLTTVFSIWFQRLFHAQRAPLRPKDQQGVAHIKDAGHHLLDLINEVLDISRIEAGQVTLSLEAVCVQAVAAECMDLLAPLAAQSAVALRLDPALNGQAHVQADPQRLKQVLVNLLANAIKYNRRGGTVTLSCVDRPHNRLRLAVTDTGAGIVAEKIARLFTPFERLDAEQSGVEGTGLGLALSKGLVELMGGTLGVESAVEVGSTFWIELPRAAPPPLRQASEAGEEAEPRVAAGLPQTFLQIEDNRANAELMASILSQCPNVTLLTAMQGRLGMNLAHRHHPNLILLDVHLPDMRGDEVLRRLKDDPATREIPVVVVSADATHEQEERLLATGAHAYLIKPLDLRYFLHVVDAVLLQKVDGRPRQSVRECTGRGLLQDTQERGGVSEGIPRHC